MGSHKKSDPVEQEHSDTLDSDIGPLYHALHGEVMWLREKWQEYKALYCHSDDRIALLNDTAGDFFGTTQLALYDGILLHIARLTDPPNHNKKPERHSLTLRRLHREVPEAKTLHKLVSKACKASEFVRPWRNNQLAHSNLGMALNPNSKAKLLPPIDREQINNALDCFLDVLREICRSVLPGEKLAAGPVVIMTGGVNAIVKHMEWALEHKEFKLKELKKTWSSR